MSTLIIASAHAGAGRSTVASALASLLGEHGQRVHLARMVSADGPDASANDDARQLALVPGCSAERQPVSEQDALALAREYAQNGVFILEAPPGDVSAQAARLEAKVILVTQTGEDITGAASSLGAAPLGVVATRLPEGPAAALAATLQSAGVSLLGVLPEDRQLAGPTIREIADILHASRLVEQGVEDEAVEHVMLGPISADPGQPYFLQHGSKAVVNRFDKMDLHLAALATEPDCLILTGGQMPSPYLLDRAAASDFPLTVLLAPDGTVRTVELLDGLFGNTSFRGERKMRRAVDLAKTSFDQTLLSSVSAA